MKILVIRLSSLGDIILTQPICAILQRVYPHADIHYICKPGYTELLQMFDPPVTPIAYSQSLAFHKAMRKEKYDIVIDLHGKLASILLRLIVKAKKRVGYNKKRSTRIAIVKGDKLLSIDSTISLYANSLKKLGIEPLWQYPKLQSRVERHAVATDSIRQAKIAIFPGATHFTKRYPTQSWIKLMQLLPLYSFSLFGSADDQNNCSVIAAQNPANCKNLAGKFEFGSLLDALQDYDLIISGDTGPMHLAATLFKSQIAIFGGTHPRLGFRPLNDSATILCAELPCQPCSLHGLKQCPLDHFKCMKSIEPGKVAALIQELLAKPKYWRNAKRANLT
ncbi:MAG: glycosyltransferase family 9 protein [Candidatus Cloacimonas sp.]|jgi:heptosyltransferase-2|nr:glycosyltransferase family 9 protein [Candidatus Cloacimonas sp.]